MNPGQEEFNFNFDQDFGVLGLSNSCWAPIKPSELCLYSWPGQSTWESSVRPSSLSTLSTLSTLSSSSGSQDDLPSSSSGSTSSLPLAPYVPPQRPYYGYGATGPLYYDPYMHVEQFKIDRRKLETMMTADTGILQINMAVAFFAMVMNNTQTNIEWPRNMKLNGKYHKDPTVKISGPLVNVSRAKEIVLENLAPKGPVLRLKIHICKMDHPHIIGRRGSNVNSIMKTTDTRIHFADIGKTDQTNSHQVVILGTLECLDRARASLRVASPLTMKLVIALKANMFKRTLVEHFEKLEACLKVEITSVKAATEKSYTVSVKGTEQGAHDVKVAVQSLISQFLSDEEQISVFLEFNIAPEVRETLTENGHAHLNAIKQSTMTDITIMPVGRQQMSRVTVTGTYYGIHEAKKAIMLLYPVELIFDIEGTREKECLLTVVHRHGLEHRLKQKDGDHAYRVTLKTLEHYSHRLFCAYREMLDMKKIDVRYDTSPGGELWNPPTIHYYYAAPQPLSAHNMLANGENVTTSPQPSECSDEWMVTKGPNEAVTAEDLEVATIMSVHHCPSPPIVRPMPEPAPTFNRAPGAERRRRI